jgi:hypothetical protein
MTQQRVICWQELTSSAICWSGTEFLVDSVPYLHKNGTQVATENQDQPQASE